MTVPPVSTLIESAITKICPYMGAKYIKFSDWAKNSPRMQTAGAVVVIASAIFIAYKIWSGRSSSADPAENPKKGGGSKVGPNTITASTAPERVVLTVKKLRQEVKTLIQSYKEDGFEKAKQSNLHYAQGFVNQAYYESEGRQSSSILALKNGGAILLGSIRPLTKDGGCVLYGSDTPVTPDAVVLVQGKQECMDTVYGGEKMPHDTFTVPEENRHYFADELKVGYADCKKGYFVGEEGQVRIKNTIRFYVDQLLQGKKVFSHCSSAKDRSPALALGALIYLLGDNKDTTYMTALNFLLSKRTLANCDFSLEIDADNRPQVSFHKWYVTPIRAAVAEMIAEDKAPDKIII
jgi:hypothetical protein